MLKENIFNRLGSDIFSTLCFGDVAKNVCVILPIRSVFEGIIEMNIKETIMLLPLYFNRGFILLKMVRFLYLKAKFEF